MQTLSKVPFKELRIGDRVKSKVTNNEGFISQFIPIEQARRRDDNEIIVKWNTGAESMQWHFNYDAVWLM